MENSAEIFIVGRRMSRLLGDRLRTLRGSRGWSQERMGKLFGMSQGAYQRLEAGKHHHHEPMLDRIDQVLVANGFDWRAGMAAELDRADLATAILDRLDRLETILESMRDDIAQIKAFMAEYVEHLGAIRHDRTIVERLRAVIDEPLEDDGD